MKTKQHETTTKYIAFSAAMCSGIHTNTYKFLEAFCYAKIKHVTFNKEQNNIATILTNIQM